MSRFSGVVLDFYDDRGATLKTKYPTIEDLPDQIKTASVTPKDELPDEAFALVALDEGEVLKKFACDNAGTTAMSVLYFMEHGDKLPQAAMEKVAGRLTDACVEYGILPPAVMVKSGSKKNRTKFTEDMGHGAAAGALIGGLAGGIKGGPRTAIPGALIGAGLGTGVGAVRGVKRQYDYAARDRRARERSKTAGIKALGAIGALGGAAGGAMAAGEGKRLSGAAGGAIAGGAALAGGGALAKHLTAKGVTGAVHSGVQKGVKGFSESMSKAAEVVDITGQMPMTRVVKTAHRMYRSKFPIDSWSQVKQAEGYLQDEGCRMDRGVYRECSVKLAARADEMGYPLDGKIKEAGAQTFADMEHRLAAMGMRKQLGADGEFLDELFVKTATMEPEHYAEVLRRFDIDNGLDGFWGQRIPDPWESTFGLEKTAETIWESGGDRLTEHALRNLVENGLELVTNKFTNHMADALRKDPKGIFNSLPEPEKRLLARLAEDVMSDGESMGSNDSPTKEAMAKEAKLRVGDIEDRLGIWLPDEKEQRVRKMIKHQESKRFALRHPWITGIPTLGIAPAVSEGNAIDAIHDRLMRTDPLIRSQTSEVRAERRQRRMEQFKLDTERARAEQAERVAGQAASALLTGLMIHQAGRDDD